MGWGLLYLYQTINEMMNEGIAQVDTEAQTRSTFLVAAAEAFPRAFSPMSIKLAFRKPGLFPPNADPQLSNPCIAELPQSLPAPKRTNADISAELLDDISTIPARRAKTLKDRQAKAAATRSQRAAVAAAISTTPAVTATTFAATVVAAAAEPIVESPSLPSPAAAANVIVAIPALPQQLAAALSTFMAKDPKAAASAPTPEPEDITDSTDSNGVAAEFACDDLEIMRYAQEQGILHAVTQKHP